MFGNVRVVRDSRRMARKVPDDFQIADHNLQQIIEIMRDPAGQVTDGVHLLGLMQDRLGRSSLSDLRQQLPIGLGQLLLLTAEREAQFSMRAERPMGSDADGHQRGRENRDHHGRHRLHWVGAQEADDQRQAGRQNECHHRRQVRGIDRQQTAAHARNHQGKQQLVRLDRGEQQRACDSPKNAGGHRAADAQRAPGPDRAAAAVSPEGVDTDPPKDRNDYRRGGPGGKVGSRFQRGKKHGDQNGIDDRDGIRHRRMHEHRSESFVLDQISIVFRQHYE